MTQMLYNELKGIKNINYYKNGNIESIFLEEKNELIINKVKFIPQYDVFSEIRKYVPSLKFYPEGELKAIILQDSTPIEVNNMYFQIEKVTFYKGGQYQRIFMKDGKISGYWTEDDEYRLAYKYKLDLGVVNINNKIISLYLYEGGKIKAITLWPKERIKINIEKNINIICRIGISLYEEGKLKSCEPAIPQKIKTIIGDIEVYNENAIGIHGENNSLKFYEDGKIKSLITSSTEIRISDKLGNEIEKYIPKIKTKYLFSSLTEKETIEIEFKEKSIVVNNKKEYEFNNFSITTVNSKSNKNIKVDNINLYVK